MDEMVRIELFNGYIKRLETPWIAHHRILNGITRAFYDYFDNHETHEIYRIPLDVRLTKSDKSDHTITDVVQPDVIIAHKNTLDDAGVVGIPTVLFEIYQSETAHKKMFEKFNIYEAYGVKEFWLIDVSNKSGRIYCLNDRQKYELHCNFTQNDTVSLLHFPHLSIDMTKIF